MQYSFVAAALVASVAAIPSYAPPAYAAPPPPSYEVASSAEAVHEATHPAPVYASSSSAAETKTAVVHPSKETSAVVYHPTASTEIVYATKSDEHNAQSTEIVYETKSVEHPAAEASTIYVCPSKAYSATVVTIVKTLTQTIDNKPTQYYETVTETQSVVIATKTDEQPKQTAPAGSPQQPEQPKQPEVPTSPEAPKYEQPKGDSPAAPAPGVPAPASNSPVQQIGDGQIQNPAKPAGEASPNAPAAYPAAAGNGTASPIPSKSGNNGAAGNGTKTPNPYEPQQYTGAASSISAFGLIAGLGAMAAFFL